MKKFGILVAMLLTAALLFTGCAQESFDASSSIATVSREDGSGTRGAFVELMGLEDEEGNDLTDPNADIAGSTSVMMTNVAGNPYAIGYISLGSLDDTVKAITVDGVEASVAEIEAGNYKVSRPFNIAVKQDSLSEVAQDFVNYILSTEGQAVIEEEGYIPLSDTEAFEGSQPSGDVRVSGSSSVSPVMEKLIEAYKAVNPNANIQLQESDSTTGMNDAIEDRSDIGMASRDLKDSELESGLTGITIATDGIAVIVNNENPVEGLTSEQIKQIFTGEVTTWESFVS